jgi:hypothetical protein
VPAPAAGAAVLNRAAATLAGLAKPLSLARVQAAKAGSVETQFTEDLAGIYEEILKHAMVQGYENLKLEEPAQP